MAEQTSNHDWTIPTVGEDTNTWGQILNDFFDGELDEQVTLEGPYSERPSAADGNVKLYLATDRRIVYYNDGSSWEAVYGLGTDSNPVPGTSHFESVSTGSAIIGGQQADYHWEHLTTVTDSQSSGSDLPVDLPLDLEPHDEIMLRYDAQVSGDAGDITLRRQGDGASNSNYEHVDISGNLTADAAALPLFNKGNTNFPVSVAGDLWIEEVSFNEVGISHRLGPTRLSNITTWSIAGTYDGGDDFSDISLDAPGYFDSIKVEVFARSEIE